MVSIENNEVIVNLPIKSLVSFENHPFEVRDDNAMAELSESINDFGILTPIVVRPIEDNKYEIVSGHRRVHASELSGKTTVPAVIRELTRDQAIISLVDSNLQRDEILPSERAKAYKMKLDALKRQGARTDMLFSNDTRNSTSHQVGEKLNRDNFSVSKVAKDSNTSASQIHRFIRLNELNPEIQKIVDNKNMGLTPAVELSYLKPEEQDLLVITMESEDCTPSLSQAQRMRKLSSEGKLNEDSMLDIMMEQKKPESTNIVFKFSEVSPFFSSYRTPVQIKSIILKLLESYQIQQQKKEKLKSELSIK